MYELVCVSERVRVRYDIKDKTHTVYWGSKVHIKKMVTLYFKAQLLLLTNN